MGFIKRERVRRIGMRDIDLVAVRKRVAIEVLVALQQASAAGVAIRYGDLLDGYIVDHADAHGIGNVGARVTTARTLMTSLHDRETLARVALDAAADARASQR